VKLIFAGTPPFAATALDTLVKSGFDVCLVLTQPDRPAGRGLRALPSAVKNCAQTYQLPTVQPASLNEPGIYAQLRDVKADALVVAAYGLLLPLEVIAMPPRGCLNIHASLLPRWRGAAPIQRAILAGDCETGVTIMQMDEGLDTGAILLQERIAIENDDTAQSLQEKLAGIGARCLVQALRTAPPPRAQDASLANYAKKISKSEAVIDWSRSASDICRQIRAFNPVPGAVTTWKGTALKIWSANMVAGVGIPGSVMAAGPDGVRIATGAGAVSIGELQKAGGKRLSALAFLGGASLVPGEQLGT
jgi:methionyl-tRNA formyltransferase